MTDRLPTISAEELAELGDQQITAYRIRLGRELEAAKRRTQNYRNRENARLMSTLDRQIVRLRANIAVLTTETKARRT